MTKEKNNILNKVFAAVQTLGPSLTTGIAVIPLGGLLMGLASILTNATFTEMLPFLQNSVVIAIATLFQNIGSLIINNLAVIFCVSVAMSYCKKDAVAAFSALLGFLAMHTTIGQILSITAESTTDWTRYATVLGIPTLNVGVLGGILMGVVTVLVYKKCKDVKLPKAFSFFQGKRFVPLATIVAGIITAIPVSIIWPLLQNVIAAATGDGSATYSIYIMSALSFATFLLMPLGLHTILYATWAYQVGTYVTASGDVIHGLLNIFFAQMADGVPLTTTVPLTGNYLLTGCLIGVAAAIIKESKKEKKDNTKSLFMGGIITNLVTGITEPLVFPYVFAAPVLYILAVVTMFVGEYIIYFLNVTVGISYCGGLVDFLIYGVLQNASHWWMLPFIAAALGVVTYSLGRLLIRKLHLNVPGQEGFETQETVEKKELAAGQENLAEQILDALGGRGNIVEIDACATRLRVQLREKAKIKKEVFTATGASGIMAVGNNLQIVYGTQAAVICEQIKDVLRGGKRAGQEKVEMNSDNQWKEDIVSPADGKLVPLSSVDDKIFAEGMMGTGFAIEPKDGKIYSPVNGKIDNVFPTKHAMGIISDEGKEILIHMGIDTVKMDGNGFEVLVQEGEMVEAGQPVAKMNIEKVEKAGHKATVMVVFTNIAEYQLVLKKTGEVSKGEKDIAVFERK